MSTAWTWGTTSKPVRRRPFGRRTRPLKKNHRPWACRCPCPRRVTKPILCWPCSCRVCSLGGRMPLWHAVCADPARHLAWCRAAMPGAGRRRLWPRPFDPVLNFWPLRQCGSPQAGGLVILLFQERRSCPDCSTLLFSPC